MNLLGIIYLLGAAAVGFLAGMIVELGIDSDTIRMLREHNHKLQMENIQLRNEHGIERVEIVDPTVADFVDYSWAPRADR